jgi:hypothetical protein
MSCSITAAFAVTAVLASCRGEQSGRALGGDENVMSVVAQERSFQAPDSIAAGWMKFGELPAWFGKVVFMGGVGLTAPGHTSESTVHLEPGTYLLECYVKTAGTFHSFNPDTNAYGMVHQFTVTAPASPATEPRATLELTVSSTRGIESAGEPALGPQTVAVHFEDQNAYEIFVGHDVHVVRLAEGTNLDTLVAWMDWTQKSGLLTPAPAEFLGGLDEMPAGATGYFTVTLLPGATRGSPKSLTPMRRECCRNFRWRRSIRTDENFSQRGAPTELAPRERTNPGVDRDTHLAIHAGPQGSRVAGASLPSVAAQRSPEGHRGRA